VPWSTASSTASTGGGPSLQPLLFAVVGALAAFFGPRARRMRLFGAVVPRFAFVSLTERPG
jgi:hypothetical protein